MSIWNQQWRHRGSLCLRGLGRTPLHNISFTSQAAIDSKVGQTEVVTNQVGTGAQHSFKVVQRSADVSILLLLTQRSQAELEPVVYFGLLEVCDPVESHIWLHPPSETTEVPSHSMCSGDRHTTAGKVIISLILNSWRLMDFYWRCSNLAKTPKYWIKSRAYRLQGEEGM